LTPLTDTRAFPSIEGADFGLPRALTVPQACSTLCHEPTLEGREASADGGGEDFGRKRSVEGRWYMLPALFLWPQTRDREVESMLFDAHIAVRVRASEKAKVIALADLAGISESDVIRGLIA
jgi:hypothetical protein